MLAAMLEVAATDEFASWYDSLTVDQALAVERAVVHLEVNAETMSAPSSAPAGNRINVRQMAVPEASVRIWFILDKGLKKTLLLCGDATNGANACVEYLQRAEELWKAYLDESGQPRAELPWSGKSPPS